ncbi:MAG: hypothetical protein WCL00_12675, partial [Bacteroidota bacterium]
MKTKTIHAFTILLLVYAFLYNIPLAKTQVLIPITPQGGNITIDIPGIGDCSISINATGNGFNIDTGNPNLILPNVNFFYQISCIAPRHCKGKKNVFYAVNESGELYEISLVRSNSKIFPDFKRMGKADLTSSNGYLKVEVDDVYVNDLGLMGVSHDTGATWTIDTTGLGRLTDFALDTAQNVYAVKQNGLGLFYQIAKSNLWQKVNSFPPGASPQKIFIDRNNRIFVGTSGNGVYYSYNHGNTWAQGITGINSTGCGLMCDDYHGNIYMINNVGSKIFRSVDGGMTWTEPPGDTAITNRLSPSSSFITVINSIS